MNAAEARRFKALVDWNQANGGNLNPAVEIYNDPITNISLRVKQAETLATGDHSAIVSCPLSTTLSVLNALTGTPLPASISGQDGTIRQSTPAFPEHFLQNVPPHVVSRFYLIQQYLLGPESHWHAYIASLPQPEHLTSWNLPPFWPGDDAAVLAGTNAGVAAGEMAAIATEESKQGRRALRDSGLEGWREYSPLLYRWAYCIFTSRSFRPSLVVPLKVWDRLKVEHAQYLEGIEMDDFSILMPLFDIANHDPLVHATWDSESVQGECHLLVNGRMGKGYGPGEQIFNNYGLKTNSELLVAYGFIIPESGDLHNDYIHVRLQTQASEKNVTTASKAAKPQDFLISLDPMSSQRSVVGRSRQWVFDRQGLVRDFAHCQDGLLWLFCEAYLREQIPDHGERVARLASILADPTPEEDKELVESLREFLLAKLQSDYIKISEEGCEAMETLLAEGSTTDNQEMGIRYLEAVVRVCQNSLVALDSTISFQHAVDDDKDEAQGE